MSNFKPSKNALKGYNFQGTVYSYLLCLMDLKREIVEVNAEINTNNNFDDIYVDTNFSSYYFQIKNYSNINFNDLIFEENLIKIKDTVINVGNLNKVEKNILLIKNLIIPNDKISGEIFGLDCYNMENYCVVGYSQEEMDIRIKNMYMNEKRYIEIMNMAENILNSGRFSITINDLPALYLFEQKLQQETLMIRHINLDNENKQICIVGKPGIGKSHLINELEMSGVLSNCIIERLWISEQDRDKDERIKFEYFLRDIIYRLFEKSEIVHEDEVIKKLETENITLIIDGLDHVENYNNEDMPKFINFIKKISNSRLIIMTRPLRTLIPLEKVELNNWSFDESRDYLNYEGINNYEVCDKIFEICKGYPIITYYLAQHYSNNKNIPDIKDVSSVIDFYDSLVGDSLPELSIFLINDSYFKKNELRELLGEREYRVIEKILNNYKYLFDVKCDRIYFIHDSLNYYLRSKELDYLRINKDVLEKIICSIKNNEIKYLTRIKYIHISQNDKINIAKSVCKFDYLTDLLLKTIDYEAVQMIYDQIENIIFANKNEFDIYEYYEFVLIQEVLNRDHHVGFYLLMLEREKYYIKNSLINTDNIYSSKILYCIYNLIINNNDNELKMFLKNSHFDMETEMNTFYRKAYDDERYFDILSKEIDIETYLKDNIVENYEYKNTETLIYILSYLFIKKIKYNGYEQIVPNIISGNVEKAKYECAKLFQKYKIREFFIESFLSRLKDYIFSLGIDIKDNYYRYKSLKNLILDNSKSGSFYVNDYVINYIRLANFENREIDIENLCLFYFMYYNRKDYSMYTLPQAMKIFVEKGLISCFEAITIINNAMEMSEKGIRTIMTDFYNIISIKDFELLNKTHNISQNTNLIISDLKSERINRIDEKIVLEYVYKHIIRYYYSKNIDYECLGNLLKSKYKKEILQYLHSYGIKINNVSAEEFDIDKYEKKEKNSVFGIDRNYIDKKDEAEIIRMNINCTELAKRVDGWHNTLPYINLFKCYSTDELGQNIIDITHNACFSYKIYNRYANRVLMVGNYLELLDMCNIDIDWQRQFNTFLKFLKISLIL